MSTSNSVEQEALAGRLPVLSGNRVYKSYGSFLWTCCAFSAATWAFLIGSYLPYVGDWRLGVIGYGDWADYRHGAGVARVWSTQLQIRNRSD